jgi:uncharacterized protein YdaT
MAKRDVHVVPHAQGWAVEKTGSKRASKVTETQREAIAEGRRIAQQEKSELVVHGENGRIREKSSHGIDPFPPKG